MIKYDIHTFRAQDVLPDELIDATEGAWRKLSAAPRRLQHIQTELDVVTKRIAADMPIPPLNLVALEDEMNTSGVSEYEQRIRDAQAALQRLQAARPHPPLTNNASQVRNELVNRRHTLKHLSWVERATVTIAGIVMPRDPLNRQQVRQYIEAIHDTEMSQIESSIEILTETLASRRVDLRRTIEAHDSVNDYHRAIQLWANSHLADFATEDSLLKEAALRRETIGRSTFDFIGNALRTWKVEIPDRRVEVDAFERAFDNTMQPTTGDARQDLVNSIKAGAASPTIVNICLDSMLFADLYGNESQRLFEIVGDQSLLTLVGVYEQRAINKAVADTVRQAFRGGDIDLLALLNNVVDNRNMNSDTQWLADAIEARHVAIDQQQCPTGSFDRRHRGQTHEELIAIAQTEPFRLTEDDRRWIDARHMRVTEQCGIKAIPYSQTRHSGVDLDTAIEAAFGHNSSDALQHHAYIMQARSNVISHAQSLHRDTARTPPTRSGLELI